MWQGHTWSQLHQKNWKLPNKSWPNAQRRSNYRKAKVDFHYMPSETVRLILVALRLLDGEASWDALWAVDLHMKNDSKVNVWIAFPVTSTMAAILIAFPRHFNYAETILSILKIINGIRFLPIRKLVEMLCGQCTTTWKRKAMHTIGLLFPVTSTMPWLLSRC